MVDAVLGRSTGSELGFAAVGEHTEVPATNCLFFPPIGEYAEMH